MAIIAIYSGSASHIPPNWQLCDGTNGTPDLRNRFIKGAQNLGEVGITGGATSHIHSVGLAGAHAHGVVYSAGSHTHGFAGAGGWMRSDPRFVDVAIDDMDHRHSLLSSGEHSHATQNVSHVPPYYALCYMVTERDNWDFPVKSIVMWCGTAENIPPNWQLCDGTNGTPDLRNRFIKGAQNLGEVGGSATHTHSTSVAGSHSHSLEAATFSHTHDQGDESVSGEYYEVGTTYNYKLSTAGPSHGHYGGSTVGSHVHVIGEDSNDPLYYKLAFIQKVA